MLQKPSILSSRDLQLDKICNRWQELWANGCLQAKREKKLAEKRAKNPPLFKKLLYASSVEQEALEAFAAKKKLEEQRYELKQFLSLTYGPKAWNALLAMEGQIRKDRQKAIYERQKFKEQIINISAIIFLCITIIGFVILLAYLWKKKYGG